MPLCIMILKNYILVVPYPPLPTAGGLRRRNLFRSPRDKVPNPLLIPQLCYAKAPSLSPRGGLGGGLGIEEGTSRRRRGDLFPSGPVPGPSGTSSFNLTKRINDHLNNRSSNILLRLSRAFSKHGLNKFSLYIMDILNISTEADLSTTEGSVQTLQ